MVVEFIRRVGLMRAVFGLFVLVVVGFAPFAGGEAIHSDIRVVPTMIMPALTPIVFFVLMLDALMSRVFMVDAEGTERLRLRFIMRMELALAALLVLAWAPFFATLGQ